MAYVAMAPYSCGSVRSWATCSYGPMELSLAVVMALNINSYGLLRDHRSAVVHRLLVLVLRRRASFFHEHLGACRRRAPRGPAADLQGA